MASEEFVDKRAVATLVHRPGPHQVDNVTVLDHGRVHMGDNYNITYNISKDKRKEIVQKLSFPEMYSRCEDISEEHEGTCEWIFAERSQNRGWSAYSDWMKSNQPIYWISGKPGSGKSVLMKYLHTTMSDEADHNSLVLSYWFWEAGTKLQQTYIGCLRALLCQCLDNISVSNLTSSPENLLLRPIMPTARNLKKILLDVLTAAKSKGLVISILLDGIDEAGSCAGDIIDFVEDLARAINTVKICVSSRSEQLLQERLSCYPTLLVQDFNQADISKVVNDQLFQKPWIMQQLQNEPSKKEELQDLIIYKAEGVFLWVRIAIRHIELGLTNRDTIDMIRARLERLPSDLNVFNDTMLCRNDKDIENYRSTAAVYLRILLHQKNYYSKGWSLLAFCLSVDHEMRAKLIEQPNLQLREADFAHWQDIKDSVNARSGGILQLTTSTESEWLYRGALSHLQALTAFRVQFIHRSARTYILSTSRGQNIIAQSNVDETTAANICFQANLISYFILPGLDGYPDRVWFAPFRCKTCPPPQRHHMHLARRVWDAMHAQGRLHAHEGWAGIFGRISWPGFCPFPVLKTRDLNHARLLCMWSKFEFVEEALDTQEQDLSGEEATFLLMECMRYSPLSIIKNEAGAPTNKLLKRLAMSGACLTSSYTTIYGEKSTILPHFLELSQYRFNHEFGELMTQNPWLEFWRSQPRSKKNDGKFVMHPVLENNNYTQCVMFGQFDVEDLPQLTNGSLEQFLDKLLPRRIFLLARPCHSPSESTYYSHKWNRGHQLYPIDQAQSSSLLEGLKIISRSSQAPDFSINIHGALDIDYHDNESKELIDSFCHPEAMYPTVYDALIAMGKTTEDMHTYVAHKEALIRQFNLSEDLIYETKAMLMFEAEENLALINYLREKEEFDEYRKWVEKTAPSTTPPGELADRDVHLCFEQQLDIERLSWRLMLEEYFGRSYIEQEDFMISRELNSLRPVTQGVIGAF